MTYNFSLEFTPPKLDNKKLQQKIDVDINIFDRLSFKEEHISERKDNIRNDYDDSIICSLYSAPSFALNSVCISRGSFIDNTNSYKFDNMDNSEQKMLDAFYKSYKPNKKDKTKIFKTVIVYE